MRAIGNILTYLFSPILIALLFVKIMWENDRKVEMVLIIIGIIAIYNTMAPPYY